MGRVPPAKTYSSSRAKLKCSGIIIHICTPENSLVVPQFFFLTSYFQEITKSFEFIPPQGLTENSLVPSFDEQRFPSLLSL